MEALPDQVFSHAESVAAKSEKCRTSCVPAVNADEYCEFVTGLKARSAYLGKLGSALVAGSLIFDQAAASNMTAISTLTQKVSLLAKESFDLLHIALKALLTGNIDQIVDNSWRVNGRDIVDIGILLDLMSRLEMIDTKASGPAKALQSVGWEIGHLGADVREELSRTKLTEPSTLSTLSVRILNIAGEIAWVVESLNQSQWMDKNRADRQIASDANVLPDTTNARELQMVGTCFSKLSLAAEMAKTGLSAINELLSECRTFSSCQRNLGSHEKPVSLYEFINMQEMAEKNFYAVVSSMCR